MARTRENRPASPASSATLRLPPFYDRLGRGLLALPFIGMGITRLLDPQASVESWSGAGVGMPYVAHVLSASLEIVGGVLLVLGVQVWSVAMVLLVYLLPFTFLMHLLPAHEDPGQRMQIARSAALAGGLLLAAGVHRADRPRWFRREA